ncbi:phage tail protein [Microterricola viridarii]|uniref:Microcystin-dependent protein n=1 Tax=Microterricola viridarii TaxID=412690 RepID=A0A1H1LDV0_9MICO|nr:tail fiber protein [Microterricola viridarii]SDR72683.1 Microcystin-dependent protein [Microterricola viridarii]
MAEPFLSEIRLFSFGFPPKGWAFCDGQLLPINQNQGLFSLLGTTYGGNGQTTFGLPDMRGRSPLHVGSGHTLGERGGEQAHTLTLAEMPAHRHAVNVATLPGQLSPAAGIPAAPGKPVFAAPSRLQSMAPSMVANTGGSQAHQNISPYLTLNFCIALTGIFPSQN